jgi:hypothetical protein
MDGVVHYYGKILTFDQANRKNDELVVFGKHIVTKRKTAWYGDSNYQYIYSNTIKQGLPWTREQ